jgi:glycosyltransferase involved in cell wall biosynthesis
MAHRVAIVHPWYTVSGGAERVVGVIASIYPDADYFAMFAHQESLPAAIRHKTVKTSFLNGIPRIDRYYAHLLPLHPLAVESLDLGGYDLVISSDAQMVKGVVTDEGATHVCYCHSPKRSLWDQYNVHRSNMGRLTHAFFTYSAHAARGWDFSAAQRVDAFAASSRHIQKRIAKYYRQPSAVIYPPIDTASAYLAKGEGDYYLSVGRLVGYKRWDILIAACNQLERPLHIVGDGPEEKNLRAIAGPTIQFLGTMKGIEDPRLQAEYANCKAFLFAGNEDFGIVPLEAQAFGRPVIAYGRGGSLETVIGNDSDDPCSATGIYFKEQDPHSLAEAILRFEAMQERFNPEFIRSHALSFDTEVFKVRMKNFVDAAIENRGRL